MKKTLGFVFITVIVVTFFIMKNKSEITSKNLVADPLSSKSQVEEQSKKLSTNQNNFEKEAIHRSDLFLKEEQGQSRNMAQDKKQNKNTGSEKSNPTLLTYTIDDRVAVTQGDMVLGEFEAGALLQALSGQVAEPEVKAWPTSEIAYYVQANVPNQERIQEALQMFNQTAVRFIAFNDHQDAIVFERTAGVCKSYVGYIGGLQKIFIADQCSAREIAHEVMHSLGFIHEQNRADRDTAISILWQNIEPSKKANFEKFSNTATSISGLAQFDFESIMLYPEKMFSVNGQSTMKTLFADQLIAPRASLSAKDIERINKIYE